MDLNDSSKAPSSPASPSAPRHTRTAIVTGSNSGIGLGVARHLLSSGWNVVLHGRDVARLREVDSRLGAPGRTATVAGDIARRETGESLVRTAIARFARLDALVNNAGTFATKPFVDVTEQDLDGFLHGNLRGTYITTQAAVRAMLQSGGGSIVNIGTVLVDHPMAGAPASAAMASKGGIHALTRSLAAELAEHGIRVNLVAPGMVRTPLHGSDHLDHYRPLSLLHSVGDVDDIARAVHYLLEAPFVTGHVLNVDGGFVTGRRAPWAKRAAADAEVTA